jgi:hypothetical protein
MVVPEMLGMIGKAAALTATTIATATEEAERYSAAISGTTSGVPRAGTAAGTMGSAPSDGVTTNGLAAALQITRGRSR